MKKAIVLWSGGADSTVIVADLLAQGRQVLALNIDIGSIGQAKEERVMDELRKHLDVEYRQEDLSFLYRDSKSLLLGDPQGTPVVEFRNSLYISVAATIAEQLGIEEIYIGITKVSAAPDTFPDYIKTIKKVVSMGSGGRVSLKTPLLELSQVDVLKKGQQLGVDLDLTYSCHMGTEEPCGNCSACQVRNEAFKELN